MATTQTNCCVVPKAVVEFFACGHYRLREDLVRTWFEPPWSCAETNNLKLDNFPTHTQCPVGTEMPTECMNVADHVLQVPIEEAQHLFTFDACPRAFCQDQIIPGSGDVIDFSNKLTAADIYNREVQKEQIQHMLRINEFKFVDVVSVVEIFECKGMKTACPWQPYMTFGQVLAEIDLQTPRNLLSRLNLAVEQNDPAFMINILYSIAYGAMARLSERLIILEQRILDLHMLTKDGTIVAVSDSLYTAVDRANWLLNPPARRSFAKSLKSVSAKSSSLKVKKMSWRQAVTPSWGIPDPAWPLQEETDKIQLRIAEKQLEEELHRFAVEIGQTWN